MMAALPVRPAILVLLLLAGQAAMAGQCHYFWFNDCFEIRDARTRDITHHVLISGGPYDAGEATDSSCEAQVASQITVDDRAQVLKRFNKVLRKLDGCPLLDELDPQVFPDGETANAEWRRLQAERAFKQTHRITRLPED